MAAPPELIDFGLNDRAAVLARMDQLRESKKGWINLSPALDEDEEPPPPRSSTFGLFSGRGPDVPLCTWLPGPPVQIGIQHGAGAKAVEVLRNLSQPVPDGWRVTQDHSRRGLVVIVPNDTPDTETLDWLLKAGAALASHLKLAAWWRAAIYTG
ncbi:MAG TPA: hypothetical protein VG076_17070 [Acidimicrobiales bacterium]|nr:hypothetical protein [Acidimicrobiales bacterium]